MGQGGRKALLLLGTLLWSASSVIIYFASSYYLLLVGRIMAGIGAVALIPITTTFGFGGGITLANAFGGLAWRPPFLVMGITGLVVIVLSLFFLREPKRGRSESQLRSSIQAGKEYSYKIDIKQMVNVLRISTNRWVIFSGFVWSIPIGFYAYKVMPYLEINGVSSGSRILVFWLMFLVTACGFVSGGVLGDLAKGRRVLICVLSLALGVMFISSAFLYPGAGALRSFNILLFCSLVLVGVFLAVFNPPNIFAIMGKVNEPETRGAVFSLFNSVGYLGMSVGILVSGIGAEATLVYYRNTLLWTTFVWLLTILLWLPMFGTLKRDATRLIEIMAQRAKEMR